MLHDGSDSDDGSDNHDADDAGNDNDEENRAENQNYEVIFEPSEAKNELIMNVEAEFDQNDELYLDMNVFDDDDDDDDELLEATEAVVKYRMDDWNDSVLDDEDKKRENSLLVKTSHMISKTGLLI
ncbi:hypothetical protein QVD17_30434 [Tagetes erecta]|uniref:Uncharacterized protein n=1 Tax=Tagetes erecta TaxID=13708 RepID=A0AAD8K1J0_TARER|nr:hypothetical protein QVD17_30434 [Tagetes erecta]